MLTEAKRAANRENAKKSTGPRTSAGKAIVAKNAILHGFYCRHTVIAGEKPQELENLRASFVDRLQPAGDLETCYVERIVINAWKLRRALAAESDHAKLLGQCPSKADRFIDWTSEGEKLARHVAGFERAMDRALNQLERLRKSRVFNEDMPPIDDQNHENKPTAFDQTTINPAVPDPAPPDSILSPQHSVLIDETNPPAPAISSEFEIASSDWMKNPQNKPTTPLDDLLSYAPINSPGDAPIDSPVDSDAPPSPLPPNSADTREADTPSAQSSALSPPPPDQEMLS